MRSAVRLTAAILVASSVLALATTAHAECAWVLWIKQENMYVQKGKPHPESSTSWELRRAYPTSTECDEGKRRVWSVTAEQYADLSKWKGVEKVTSVPYEAVLLQLKESDWLLAGSQNKEFHCLPDTIDPRGPKTK